MLQLNQLRKLKDDIEDIAMEHSDVLDVKTGRLGKRGEREWRLLKCGASNTK